MPSVDALAKQVAAAYPRMAPYARELVETAGRLKFDPAWLANIIHLESGGNPQARNPTSAATGLIQFMTFTAKDLGTSIDALYQMDGKQQMPYVERYLKIVEEGDDFEPRIVDDKGKERIGPKGDPLTVEEFVLELAAKASSMS